MENGKYRCSCEDTECVDELVEDDKTEDNPSEDDECGCACGDVKRPDESLITNPDKPKIIAENNFIKEFENYAHLLGIKIIGYTLLTSDLMIEDKFIQYPNTIVLAMKMDKEVINATPGAEAKKLNDLLYEKFGKLTYKLSDYLRENGFATEVAHPDSGLVNFSPLAEKAGLGFIGKSGLLITPELGPRLKISAIFVSITNLPLKDNSDNEYSWIPDYCDKCGKCAKSCPENALIQRKTCFGGKEMEFVQRLCIGCNQGCAYCIANCPFYKKGYQHVKNKFDKMAVRLMEKQN
ncbi:4Fe-4S binding protein [Methanobacterium sp.]|uniref:4Fe-4S binding protein n=1 Tax=Methanobacterium sp. TaxID=2164 RepID=UPI003C78088C